ncbi:hypothetical protein [Deinococcus misasensis]|uniref:hypothetical protein n=1 Tax=Deinococcus misasensis TaxID=392413 RepID=UPI0005568C70|nr:hypothetical protein [Deinococcus misasensis]
MFSLFRKSAPTPKDPYVKQMDQNAFKIRVRTNRHKEVVELRFTRSADIGRNDDGDGFIYRKMVVGPNHFDRGEVTIIFDNRYNVKDVQTEGCTPIEVKDWED